VARTGIRIRFGRRSAKEGEPDGDPRSAGVLVLLFAVGLAWLAIEEGHHDLLAIALVVAASGGWLAGLYRLVRGVPRGRAIVGGLFTGWAVVGAAAAARSGYWVVMLPCAALMVVGLLVLGVIPLPARAEPVLAVVRRLWLGFLLMGLGSAFAVGSLRGAVSEGTPPWVGVVAGAVFFLGGLLFVIHGGGGGDTVIVRISNCVSRVPANGILFTVTDAGIAAALRADSGETLWRHRLPGNYFSSLVASPDAVYFTNSDGMTRVVDSDGTFRVLAQNEPGEETIASMAAADGELFIRSAAHVYAIRRPSCDTWRTRAVDRAPTPALDLMQRRPPAGVDVWIAGTAPEPALAR
jgi:hypothetical protein